MKNKTNEELQEEVRELYKKIEVLENTVDLLDYDWVFALKVMAVQSATFEANDMFELKEEEKNDFITKRMIIYYKLMTQVIKDPELTAMIEHLKSLE